MAAQKSKEGVKQKLAGNPLGLRTDPQIYIKVNFTSSFKKILNISTNKTFQTLYEIFQPQINKTESSLDIIKVGSWRLNQKELMFYPN